MGLNVVHLRSKLGSRIRFLWRNCWRKLALETPHQVRSLWPHDWPFRMISESMCRDVYEVEGISVTWWRDQKETFSALLALCAGIHRSPVNSPHKGQWRGALLFSLICTWINDWVNNRETGDSKRQRIHYDVTEIKNKPLIHDIFCTRC